MTTRIAQASTLLFLTCALMNGQTAPKITVGYYPNWVNIAESSVNPTSLKTLYQSGALTNLTYLNYAFAYVDENGNCSINAADVQNSVVRQYSAAESVDGIADSTNTTQLHGDLNQLLKLKNLLKLQGKTLKILISVGGSTYGAGTNDEGQQSTFSKAASSANAANFASTCIGTFIAGNFSNSQNGSANTLTQAYPGIFDGIDIDWEYPDYSTDNFANLVSVFRSQLNTYSSAHSTPALLLTAAMSPDLTEASYYGLSVPGYTTAAHPLTTSDVNFFNVMAYDYEAASSPVGSNAPLPGIQYDIYGLTQAGVPTSQMVLGVPFYGVNWAKCSTGCTAPTQAGLQPTVTLSSGWTASTMNVTSAGSVTTPYWSIRNSLATDASSVVIGHDTSAETDGGTSTTWGAYAYDAKTGVLWNYDDTTTIQTKAEYVLNGAAVSPLTWYDVAPLAGMMSWDLSQDVANGTLLCAIQTDLNGTSCVAPSTSEITLASDVAGASFTISGQYCPTGTYTAPASLIWSTIHGCTVTANAPSGYRFVGWMDGNESNPRSFPAQSSSATYTAAFAAGSCTFTLSANSMPAPGSATTGSVNVTTISGCPWIASSNASWITVSSGGTGTASGTVRFNIAANTTSAVRTGTLTIADQTFTVTQSVPATGGTRIFAAYVDMSLTQDEQIVSMAQQAGLKAVSLAFVTGISNSCETGWSGLNQALPSDVLSDGVSVQTVIQELQAKGIQVIISFGGYGADPAETCINVTSLQAVYQSVVTRYNVTALDFAIEGSELSDSVTISRRDQALKALQAANPNLKISYTLPATESGLTSAGLSLISQAKAAGVSLSVLNLLAMDFGPAVSNMAQAVTGAVSAVESQLTTAGLTTTSIGITPMIGVNDSAGETFTIANAQTLLSFADATKYVDRLSMWSVARDNGSCAGATSALATCSGISQSTYAFSAVLGKVQ